MDLFKRNIYNFYSPDYGYLL